MAFLDGVFDRIGDTIDGITGRTQTKLYQQQLDQQKQLNEQLIQIERERLAEMQTPEYKAAQQKRLFVGVFVLLFCVGCAVYLLRK